MKRNNTAKTFILAAVSALALSIAPTAKAADKGCSSASLKGTFVFLGTGSVIDPTGVFLLDVVFAQTFDGNGALTSTGLQSHNGNILQVTQTGTYTVNPDCTGTYTALLSPIGLTVHFFFVIADNGNELRVISTDANTVIAGTARRQFPVGDWRQ
jgi:hypothetical protein